MTTPTEFAALRTAIRAACDDPRHATLRARLFIAGFEAVDAGAWASIVVNPRLADLPGRTDPDPVHDREHEHETDQDR